ncbi:hypothetical protein [Mycolicibacterium diernhoferi]|nr:hypothetical protein [Mycolicibacterium diernhoferi]
MSSSGSAAEYTPGQTLSSSPVRISASRRLRLNTFGNWAVVATPR